MELKETFLGGLMNKDFDSRLIPDGEYIDAENLLVSNSEGSKVGLVQKSNGVDKLTNISLPNDAITIGSVTDEGNECIYWFVTSSIGNFVYEYNILDNNSLSTVLSDNRIGTDNVLNFNKDFKITGVNVIYNSFNGDKLLIWTDDLNPIRCINVNRAKSYGINGFAKQDIDLIKRAPFEALECHPTISGDGIENNIKERFLSFGYRYKYLDGEYSASSAFSNPQFYPSDFSFNFSTQENTGMINSFNAINLKFNTGDKNVTDIQLLFKESNSDIIYVIENFNKENEGYGDNTYKSFLFSNNKIYSILPIDEVNRLFDNVPLLAKAQDFIGNRILFGNYVEGRDVVDNVDFSTSFLSQNLSENTLNYELSGTGVNYDVLRIELNAKDLVQDNIISISFRANSNTPYFGGYLCDLSFYLEKTYENAYELSISPEFTTFLTSVASVNFKNYDLGNIEPANDVSGYVDKYKPFEVVASTASNILSIKMPYIHHQIDSTPLIPDDFEFTYEDEFYYIKADTVNIFSSFGSVFASCKSNRSYETGIVYLDDDGRYSTVLTSKDNTTFIPIENSVDSNSLQLTIRNKAPEWANRYKIFVKDSKLNYQTIYGVIAYKEGSFLWIKLEGQDKQKVKEGDYLIIKKSIDGPSTDVRTVQVLDYVVKDSDFIKDNKNDAGDDIIENAGVYIKVKASSSLNIDGVDKNFYELEKSASTRGDNFYVYAGSFSVNTGTPLVPVIEDIKITPGTIINIELKNRKGGAAGGLKTFKKSYVVVDEFDNFQSWFETEGSGLGDFSIYEFVRGFAKPILIGTKTRLDSFVSDPSGYLYLKIKAPFNGNGQNTSFLDSKITITTGFSVLIFETDSDDNNSEVFYETQDTYLIENGLHLSRKSNVLTDVDQTDTNPAFITLDWFNCYTQGNGAESYIVKDVFNKNFLSTNSRPNAVQLDGYKSVRNIASLTYSGAFDKTSNYNSLNEFNLSRANYKDLDDKYGSIQKIHSRDNDLIVFQEDKIHKVLFNKNVLTDAVGGGQISSVEEVLGQEVPFAGEWGISKNPESFSFYANSLYFTDSTKGVVLRLGGDGLEPISKYKMRDWFKDNLRTYKNNFKYGGYDPVHDNYVLSLSDEKLIVENELFCGQTIEWLSIEPNSSYVYKMDLGTEIGDHSMAYSLEGSDSVDFHFYINGVVNDYLGLTSSGVITVPKTSTDSIGSLTISNVSNTISSLSITNNCVSTPELEVITLVVNDDLDVSLSMTNKYTWNNYSSGKSGGSSLLDVFLSSGISRFDVDSGKEGEPEIPYNNSIIKVSSLKQTGEFTSCNRIGYIISPLDLDAQGILDLAIYPSITNIGDEYYIEFNFSKNPGDKLYMVWDYIDVPNCGVASTEIQLCYDETSTSAACYCAPTSDYSNIDYSTTDYYTN